MFHPKYNQRHHKDKNRVNLLVALTAKIHNPRQLLKYQNDTEGTSTPNLFVYLCFWCKSF